MELAFLGFDWLYDHAVTKTFNEGRIICKDFLYTVKLSILLWDFHISYDSLHIGYGSDVELENLFGLRFEFCLILSSLGLIYLYN